jgi:hypothetical protein
MHLSIQTERYGSFSASLGGRALAHISPTQLVLMARPLRALIYCPWWDCDPRAHPTGRATRSMWRTVPKKRWSSLKILGRECEGLLIRIPGLPSLFVNVHQIEAAAFSC